MRTSIIVIDDSASMSANDRFDEARERARDALSRDNVVILAHLNPSVAEIAGEERLGAGDARDIIDDLEPTDLPGDLPTALDLAVQRAGAETKVTVVSDFVLSQYENPELIAARLKVLESKGALVEIADIPAEGENAGIVDAKLNTDNGTLEIKIQNFNERPLEFGLRHNGEPVSLPLSVLAPKRSPGSFLSISVPLANGVNEFTLTPEDDFKADNTYYVSIPEESRIRVLVISNDPNARQSKLIPALDAAGDKFTRVEIEYGVPPKVPDLEHDLYVVKDIDAQFILPGVIANLQEDVEEGAVLVVLAQPDLFSVDWRGLLPVEKKPLDQLSGRLEIEVNGTLSLTKGLTDVGQADGSQLLRVEAKENAVVYATVGTNDGLEPVIAAHRLGKGAIIYYGIKDAPQHDVDPQSYAILWGRIADFSLVDPLALNVPTGALITAPGRIGTPMGRRQSPVLAQLSGIYETQPPIAANLYGLQSGFALAQAAGTRLESDIASPSQPQDEERSAEGEAGDDDLKVPKDLSMTLIIAGLCVLLLELLYIKFRGDL